jgi:hypothetical protein
MTAAAGRGRPATQFAKIVSEGFNCLAVFLCGPALRELRAEVPVLLRQWNDEYAPLFRKLDLRAAQGDTAAFRAALERISALTGSGFDPDDAAKLAALRAALRELMGALNVTLPVLSPDDAAVCELHGPACPVLAAGKR